MKSFLLLLFSCVWLSACHSTKISSVHTLVPIPEFVEESASADTLPLPANAAQTSFMETQPVLSVVQQPGFESKKPTIWKTLRLARKLAKVQPETDSTKLYTRRKMPDVRPVNNLAKVSLWTGIGTYAFLLLSAATGAGILGLLAFLSAIAAIVTGFVSLSEIRRSGDQYRGKGKAIAGLVLGFSYALLLLLVIVVLLVFLAGLQ